MELRFAHLCDYAAPGAGGKPTLVGIFDVLFTRTPGQPTKLPLCYVVARVQCSLFEGGDHAFRCDLRHEDGALVASIDLGTVKFLPAGPGRPLQFSAMLQTGGMELPAVGDYEFEFVVDGKLIGSTGLFLREAPGVG